MLWTKKDESEPLSPHWGDLLTELYQYHWQTYNKILESYGVATVEYVGLHYRVRMSREWINAVTGASIAVIYLGSLDSVTNCGVYAFYRTAEGHIINMNPEATNDGKLMGYPLPDPYTAERHIDNMVRFEDVVAAVDGLVETFNSSRVAL